MEDQALMERAQAALDIIRFQKTSIDERIDLLRAVVWPQDERLKTDEEPLAE